MSHSQLVLLMQKKAFTYTYSYHTHSDTSHNKNFVYITDTSNPTKYNNPLEAKRKTLK